MSKVYKGIKSHDCDHESMDGALGSKRPYINAVTVDLQEIKLELRTHGSCQYHAMRATALQVLQPTF